MLSRRLTGVTGHDGVLEMHVPLGLPDQSVEVMVIVEPLASAQQVPGGPVTEKSIESFYGCMKDLPSFSGDPEKIQRQMRDEWR